jgi:hypothetical protein
MYRRGRSRGARHDHERDECIVGGAARASPRVPYRPDRRAESFAENRSLVGRIRWRSVFKFKGLDADAGVLTDIGETAKQFTGENGLSFADLLYVPLTRAKYRCFVLTSD